MLWLSLFATLLVMTVHLTGSGQFCDPISLEIAAGNRVAYLLMFCLAGVILLLCRHLLRCEYYCRTGILLLAVPGLAIITVTSPVSDLHNTVFMLLVGGTILWFAVMGAEYEDDFILRGAASCLLFVPFLALFGLGLSEKVFLLYALVSANVLYYGHLQPSRRYW